MSSIKDFMSGQEKNISGWLLSDIWKFNDAGNKNKGINLGSGYELSA